MPPSAFGVGIGVLLIISAPIQLALFFLATASTAATGSVSIAPKKRNKANKHKATPPPRVCVIGCGASGLVTAKVLQERGIDVTVFEATGDVGGLWQACDQAQQRGTGCNAVYPSLHTNLPKDFMAFSDFRFPRNAEQFPHHTVVRDYLRAYAKAFAVYNVVKLNTKVLRAEFDVTKSVWVVDVEEYNQTEQQQQQIQDHPDQVAANGFRSRHQFTHVVVCNGHYNHPHLPDVPNFFAALPPHMVSHTSVFRSHEHFCHKRVLIVGSGVSAYDVSRVLLSNSEGCRLWCSARSSKSPLLQFIKLMDVPILPGILAVQHCTDSNGKEVARVHFADNTTLDFDTVVLATGYELVFPFLNPQVLKSLAPIRPVNQDGDQPASLHRLTRLYGRVFDPNNPTLSFVGLPNSLLPPWATFEYQAHWVASVIDGTSRLPHSQVMEREIFLREAAMRLPRQRDLLGFGTFPYCEWLAINAKCTHGFYWQMCQFRWWRMICARMRALVVGEKRSADSQRLGDY